MDVQNYVTLIKKKKNFGQTNVSFNNLENMIVILNKLKH